MAAVGLAQNLGAMKALSTEGIQKGHMVLHARTVAVAAGARIEEVNDLVNTMIAEGNIKQDRAEQLLSEARKSI